MADSKKYVFKDSTFTNTNFSGLAIEQYESLLIEIRKVQPQNTDETLKEEIRTAEERIENIAVR